MNYAISVKNYKEKHGFEVFRPKAVLFDMDGVLYDSMPNHAVAWHNSMKEFGIVMTRDDAYSTEGQRGVDTIRQMVKQQLGRDIDEEEAQRMYDLKSRMFHDMKEAPMMPGALNLMEKIAKTGLNIGVVTGSAQKPLIARLLSDYGNYLDEDHIVTAYDVREGKPKPAPYLMGMKKAGNLNPWETIVVENAPLGVRAAVAARCFTIAINTGRLPYDSLAREGADILMDSMEELCLNWESLGFDNALVF